MHPDIQSAGLLITSAAAQLMTLVRPAPIVVWDLQTQVKSKFLRPWSIAHDVGMTKFHVCSAMRVAISTHVAEILRGTGPQVTSYPYTTL
jgi:hypothetical protein